MASKMGSHNKIDFPAGVEIAKKFFPSSNFHNISLRKNLQLFT
jgi:hypothetical protein